MSPLDDSLLGKHLDEYQIEQPLGQGGMARVYRALDTKLGRYVALKVIAPDFRTDAEYGKRFEREAQSIARLEHPNIVRIYRYSEVNGLYYMAMQYIDGISLEVLIKDYRQDNEFIPLENVVEIIQDIAAALDYAHGKNVIHRDVKSANIMLDKQGHAILADFGLALLSDIGTQGEVLGSTHYISPEQAVSSANVVPQSDLYSLGVTLFEMLTGDLPFKGGEPLDIALRHVTDPPPHPNALNPAVPASVDSVVMRCLEKEPSDRYQTGAELAQALRSAVADWGRSGIADRSSPSPSPAEADVLNPIVPMPPLPPEMPDVATTQTYEYEPLPGATPTVLPPESAQTQVRRTQPTRTVPARQATDWRAPLLFAIALIGFGVLGLLVIIMSNRGQTPVAMAPTETVTPTPSMMPSATALPTIVTSTTVPSMVPTPTAVVLIQPTLAPPPVLPTLAAALPPADRTVAPSGSSRLGEFTVEWYCNTRGYGVVLVNGNTDWACTNVDQSVAFILQASDFDSICQSRYTNPGAFAIRDQTKDIQAYNWSCYAYVPAPAPTTPPVALPSLMTFQVRAGQAWVAFVNVSPAPLSLADFQLQGDKRALTAADWGRTVLMPAECIRIYKDKKPPKELPQDCNTVFDYPGSDPDRGYWFKGQVTVVYSPTVSFKYTFSKN